MVHIILLIEHYKLDFVITLESHQINHANSKIIIKPNYPDFAIEARHINKNVNQLFVVYARLMNQYSFF